MTLADVLLAIVRRGNTVVKPVEGQSRPDGRQDSSSSPKQTPFDRFFVEQLGPRNQEQQVELTWAFDSRSPLPAILAIAGIVQSDDNGRFVIQPDFHPLQGCKAPNSRGSAEALLTALGALKVPPAEAAHAPGLPEADLAVLLSAISEDSRPQMQTDASLLDLLHNSAVGRYHQAYAKLQNADFVQDVPQSALVVIGLQAAGKSKFMTAISKCNFSPSGKGLTTKAPVRLCLEPIPSHADQVFEVSFRGRLHPCCAESDIAQTVGEIMQTEIPGTKLTSDEITVRICKAGVPPLVLIDTPGIREDNTGSKELVSKYLRDGHLVICLVEACFINLDSHAAVQLVRYHGKVGNTRLVLTRTDEVTTRDAIQDKVLSRILGWSTQMQTAGFPSAYAVIAEHPEGSSGANSLDLNERAHFEQQIFQRLPQLDAAFHPHIDFIRQHCTVRNLIEALVPWFEDFLRREGVPIALQWLQPKLRDASRRITDLGRPVEEITVQEVMEAVELAFGLPALHNPGALSAIDAAVRTALIHLAVMPLCKPDGRLVRCVEAGFKLEESAVYNERRLHAQDQLRTLKAAMAIMESIKAMHSATEDTQMQEVAVSNSTDGDGEVRQRRADSQALEVPHAVEVEPERTPDGSKPMAMGKDEAPKSISAGAVGPSGMEEDPQEPEDGFIDLSGDEADANDSMNMTTASPVPKRMTKSARPGRSAMRPVPAGQGSRQPMLSGSPLPARDNPHAVKQGKRPSTHQGTAGPAYNVKKLKVAPPSAWKVNAQGAGRSDACKSPALGKQPAIATSGRTVHGRVKQQASRRVDLACIGNVRASPGWFDAGYIFPDGYKATIWYRSSKNVKEIIAHECSIYQLGSQPYPTFQIIAADRPNEPLTALSCSGCWDKVLQRINVTLETAGEVPPKTKIPGPEFFGLNDPEVQAAFEALDPSRNCWAYWEGKQARAQVAAKQQSKGRTEVAASKAAGNNAASALPTAARRWIEQISRRPSDDVNEDVESDAAESETSDADADYDGTG
ncbi:hypothetical protein WJX84_007087 [Apatococcus fuscideae]|uniref:Dynamin GTPase domain-containing protein n=1 Tax=Apatococcus fuscideae TaxID=2026836 RepID=A0AAW1TEC9_9CHLO